MLLREQRCLACSMPFMPVKAHLADTEPERDNLQQNSSSACFFCTNCLEKADPWGVLVSNSGAQWAYSHRRRRLVFITVISDSPH